MNALILNRDSFSLPEDGWYHVAPQGIYPHRTSGVVQVLDDVACWKMAAAFEVEAAASNFAGLLIDFDHFSLDVGQKSEAAGWIMALEARESGLWAQIRWSDTGEAAVRGGRYRFLSPVWSRSDCVDLGEGKVRPVRLLNAAVTNDPNLKGLVPLSNRGQQAEVGGQEKQEQTSNIERQTSNAEVFANAEGERRLKWVLGNSPEDRHCPSCSALAGMVQTEGAWEAARLRPKSGRLFCGGHCHCSLVETDEPVRGDLGSVRALYGNEALGNADNGLRGAEFHVRKLLKEAKWALRNNWSEEARDASIEVRKAKAKKRDDDEDDNSESAKAREVQRIREKLRRGEPVTQKERDFLNKERPQRGRG